MRLRILIIALMLIIFDTLFLKTQIIMFPNYCSGSISCFPEGECEMTDIGGCESKGCDGEHCPYSNRKCIFVSGYKKKCRKSSSVVKMCRDYCKAIPWIVCYCTSVEDDGGCFGVKDCEEY